jgi:hypothetical protein
MYEALLLIVLWCDPDLFYSNKAVIECRKKASECVIQNTIYSKQIKCLLDIKISE